MSSVDERLQRIEEKLDSISHQMGRLSVMIPFIKERVDCLEGALFGDEATKGLVAKVSVLWFLVVVIGVGVGGLVLADVISRIIK